MKILDELDELLKSANWVWIIVIWAAVCAGLIYLINVVMG